MLKILIDLSSRGLAEKLAMRLSELSGRLEITIAEGKETGADSFDCIIDDENLKEIFPVSAFLNSIIEKYTNDRGKPFYGPEKGFRRAFLFTSPMGGSGLTSCAFVFARILAGKTGAKVLFADIGRKDTFRYGEFSVIPEGKEGELNYLVEKNRGINISRFLAEDHYGPYCIILKHCTYEVIAALVRNGGFDYIVAALPEEKELISDDPVRIIVLNTKDSRYIEHSEKIKECEWVIMNRGYVNKVMVNQIHVADDQISFKWPDEGVRISMNGDFAVGLEKLYKEAVNELGYT